MKRHLTQNRNKKVVLMMKCETKGVPVTSVASLKAKMYSMMSSEDEHKLTAKGVKRHCARAQLSYQDYLDCVLKCTSEDVTFNCLRNQNHSIFTVEQTKKGITCFDDKTYILEDGISSYKWGHYRIGEKPSQTYDGVTRDELQKMLKERGLTVRGTKAQCLKRLLEADNQTH